MRYERVASAQTDHDGGSEQRPDRASRNGAMIVGSWFSPLATGESNQTLTKTGILKEGLHTRTIRARARNT